MSINKNKITTENPILKSTNKIHVSLVSLLKLFVANIIGLLIGLLYGLTIVPSIATLMNLKNSIEVLITGIIFIPVLFLSFNIIISLLYLINLIVFLGNKYIFTLLFSIGILNGAIRSINLNSNIQIHFYAFIISIIAIHIVLIRVTNKAWKEELRWKWLKDWAVYCGAVGGTSFYGRDLMGAKFDGADLRNTDLRAATLKHSSFLGAKHLELARIKGTILEDKRVRDLLIDPKSGQGKNFRGADFTGAYLVQANLQGADFTGANLQDANLTGANLAAANLRCINAIDTDFTGATLNDICIQDWNISQGTKFKDVECDGVFLKEGNREPKPDSYLSRGGKKFNKGDFEKWMKDVTDTIDLIFQGGVNLKSLAFAITKVSIDHEGTQLKAKSIEAKDDEVVVVKLSNEGDATKAELHIALDKWYGNYEKAIAEGKEDLLIKNLFDGGNLESVLPKINEIQNIRGLLSPIIIFNPTGAIEIMGEKNQAGGNIDQSNRSINSGRDFNSTGSVINSDEMSGQITNTVNQNQDLAEIIGSLQKLQTAIQDDPTLKESAKVRSLEEVKVLSEEAKKEPHERDKSILSTAIGCLSYLGDLVTDGSKLAQACQTYLPTISKFFGI